MVGRFDVGGERLPHVLYLCTHVTFCPHPRRLLSEINPRYTPPPYRNREKVARPCRDAVHDPQGVMRRLPQSRRHPEPISRSYGLSSVLIVGP